MKKNIYFYICVISIGCIFFQGIYYKSYLAVEQRMKKEEQREKQSQSEKIVSVQNIEGQLLEPGAEYVCVNVNVETKERTRQTGTIAARFVGWSKKEVERYLEEYTMQPPKEEREKGFVSLELMAFSSKCLQVKKTYKKAEPIYSYLLVVEDNEVVVYDSDWQQVYEKTGIEAQNLSAKEREKLSCGIFVKDEMELYSILEGYSS